MGHPVYGSGRATHPRVCGRVCGRNDSGVTGADAEFRALSPGHRAVEHQAAAAVAQVRAILLRYSLFQQVAL